ncbi:hypothetical protein MASR2M47_32410 [Draconibacterium sp.]
MSLNGYVKELSMYYKPVSSMPISETDSLDYLFLNQIHNRLNFRWFATDKLTFALEARNRLFFGQMIKEFPEYEESINSDNGFFNLGTVIASGESWFLHSAIDRAWVDYTLDKLQFTVGRQRINWGVNLVWNPNDIFNTYSYFEFDYEERPGTDAAKIQFYTSVTSSAQLVYKIGHNPDETAVAGKYRFLKGSTDFQVLGGWAGKDYVLGGGWSGDIKGGGFRGEMSWFLPVNNHNGSEQAFVTSVSGDYTLKNSLYLHTAVLFSSNGKTGDAGGDWGFFDQNLTAKMLALGMLELFGQVTYPFTPLFKGDFSAMVNPLDGSSFLGPMLTYALGNNWEIMVNGQLFLGRTGTEYGDYGQAIYGRLKWSF